MKNLWRRAGTLLRALHEGERGANMVEYVLIVAAVALPILAILLLYRNELMEWVQRNWRSVTGAPDPMGP
jgi:Flp pilus assembly pilin Flp